jgi:hypothetical protein
MEDFNWVAREIVEGGGDATICEARFVEGISDRQIEALFHGARDADYAQVADAARDLSESVPDTLADEDRAETRAKASRLKKRLEEIAEIDFFGGLGRDAAQRLLAALDEKLAAGAMPARPSEGNARPEEHRGRTWVTRKGIHVDRMASGWLIRRFVDPEARFKFVAAKGYRPELRELRFDMFDAEFTHEGDRCTFEVLRERFTPEDRGLRTIAEIVHDIDLKDAKFGHAATAGFELLVAGIAMAHEEDEVRLERACAILDDLYEYFRRKPEKKSE